MINCPDMSAVAIVLEPVAYWTIVTKGLLALMTSSRSGGMQTYWIEMMSNSSTIH